MRRKTNWVGEGFNGSLKYEHLYRGGFPDAAAVTDEVQRFRAFYNPIRPHEGLEYRTGIHAPEEPNHLHRKCSMKVDSGHQRMVIESLLRADHYAPSCTRSGRRPLSITSEVGTRAIQGGPYGTLPAA